MEQSKMLNCENCGAFIPADAAKCPYCGALNLPGGEKQYMDNLFELKEDVKELSSVSLEEYKKELGRTGRLFKWALVIFAVIAVLGGLLYLWVEKSPLYETDSADVKAQMFWERENYPKLDAMYEEGDYDGILEFEAMDCEDGYYSMAGWEHYDFIDVYRWYAACRERAVELDSGEYDEDNVYWFIMDAMFLMRDKSYESYDADEQELIEGYKQEIMELMDAKLGMGEEETKSLYAECCKEDEYGAYLDFKLAEKKVEAYIEDNMNLNKLE